MMPRRLLINQPLLSLSSTWVTDFLTGMSTPFIDKGDIAGPYKYAELRFPPEFTSVLPN